MPACTDQRLASAGEHRPTRQAPRGHERAPRALILGERPLPARAVGCPRPRHRCRRSVAPRCVEGKKAKSADGRPPSRAPFFVVFVLLFCVTSLHIKRIPLCFYLRFSWLAQVFVVTYAYSNNICNLLFSMLIVFARVYLFPMRPMSTRPPRPPEYEEVRRPLRCRSLPWPVSSAAGIHSLLLSEMKGLWFYLVKFKERCFIRFPINRALIVVR